MTSVIPSTQDIEKKWDRFSNVFIRYMEPITLPLSHLMINNLDLKPFDSSKTPKSVLEIACGGGSGSELCIFYKDPSTKLVSTDISSEMVQLTKKRLNIPLEESEDKSKNFTVIKADAENLPFPNESFDRYFASLSLHIVNDPIKMLKETLRVLEKGGVAAYSVWGTKEKNNKFTIVPQIASKLNIPMGITERSHFHLSDVEKLKSMAKEAGFSKVLGGYSYSNDLAKTGAEFVEAMFSTPEMQDKSKVLDPKLFEQWKKGVEEYVDDLYSKGQFIGFEIAYIVCTK